MIQSRNDANKNTSETNAMLGLILENQKTIMQNQAAQNTVLGRLCQQQNDTAGLQILQQAQEENSRMSERVQLQQPAVREVQPMSFVAYNEWKNAKPVTTLFCDWFEFDLPNGYAADIRNKRLQNGTANAYNRCKTLMRWLLRFSPRHPPSHPPPGGDAYVAWVNELKAIANDAVGRVKIKFDLPNDKDVNLNRLKQFGASIDEMAVPQGTPANSVLRDIPKPRGNKRTRQEVENDDGEGDVDD
jgi:hypothetical protein